MQREAFVGLNPDRQHIGRQTARADCVIQDSRHVVEVDGGFARRLATACRCSGRTALRPSAGCRSSIAARRTSRPASPARCVIVAVRLHPATPPISPSPYCPRTTHFSMSSSPSGRSARSTSSFASRIDSAPVVLGGWVAIMQASAADGSPPCRAMRPRDRNTRRACRRPRPRPR